MHGATNCRLSAFTDGSIAVANGAAWLRWLTLYRDLDGACDGGGRCQDTLKEISIIRAGARTLMRWARTYDFRRANSATAARYSIASLEHSATAASRLDVASVISLLSRYHSPT